jgi:hypothetical protein
VEAFTLHTETNLAERVHWLVFVFTSQRPIVLQNIICDCILAKAVLCYNDSKWFKLKYLQNLPSSLNRSLKRWWNSPKLSRLVLILCTQNASFDSVRDLYTIHCPLSKEYAVVVTYSTYHKSVLAATEFSAQLGAQCEWPLAQLGSVRPGSACSANEPLG